MVVGYDISVRADDDAAAAALLLTVLGLGEFISKKEAEEGVYVLVLLAALDGNFHVYHGLNGGFCGISEIRVIRVCQIDSAVLHCITLRIFHNSGLGGLRSGYFHYAIGGKTACQY